jgi:hypothetical protein
VLYLFDANLLITASNTYYPIDQVPEKVDPDIVNAVVVEGMRTTLPRMRLKRSGEFIGPVLGDFDGSGLRNALSSRDSRYGTDLY